METLKSLPNWFWISLAVIAVVTIGATMYCNKRSKENATDIASTLNTGTTTTTTTNQVNDQESIFDSISTIQNMGVAQ